MSDLPNWVLALIIPVAIGGYIIFLGYLERRYERKLQRRIREKF